MGKVFYFDCEMGEADIQARYNWLNKSAKFKSAEDCLRLFSFEHTNGMTLNLAEAKNQKIIEEEMEGCNLLVIDNLSQACRPTGRETMREAYQRLRDWLLRLKTRHVASLIVHHTGKNGTQRGISDIEDPLDIVMHLKRSDDWKVADGTQFEFHFEKTRCVDPSDPSILAPLFVELKRVEGQLVWNFENLQERKEKKKDDAFDTVKSWRDEYGN